MQKYREKVSMIAMPGELLPARQLAAL